MSSKSKRAKLSDLKQGRTIFVVMLDGPPRNAIVVPILLDRDYRQQYQAGWFWHLPLGEENNFIRVAKNTCAYMLYENAAYTTRRAATKYSESIVIKLFGNKHR